MVFHGSHDESDWTVTVAYTGETTMTGGRIKRVQKYIGDEPFLCTYGDGIANVDLPALRAFHAGHDRLATMTTTQPGSRFGVVDVAEGGGVHQFREKPRSDDWINIGFFIFEPTVFDYLDDNSVLEQEPLHNLARDGQLAAFKHEGFWQPMDTFRESQMLNEIWDSGKAPWKIWS
jgi:glucose-1-phosphate cytidylyltransferase